MTKRIYEVIINILVFYFVVSITTGVVIQGGNVATRVIVGLIFGLLMVSVPKILGFFKISVNTWSSLLVSVVLAFVYFFVLYTGVVDIAYFRAGVVDFGWGGLVLVLNDALSTVVFLALACAAGSVGLKQLGRK